MRGCWWSKWHWEGKKSRLCWVYPPCRAATCYLRPHNKPVRVSPGTDFALQGTVAMSGHIFSCRSWLRGATCMWWGEARDAAQCSAMHRTPPTQGGYTVPNVTSANVEKPCNEPEKWWFSLLPHLCMTESKAEVLRSENWEGAEPERGLCGSGTGCLLYCTFEK